MGTHDSHEIFGGGDGVEGVQRQSRTTASRVAFWLRHHRPSNVNVAERCRGVACHAESGRLCMFFAKRNGVCGVIRGVGQSRRSGARGRMSRAHEKLFLGITGFSERA